jgi:hypothetical protein
MASITSQSCACGRQSTEGRQMCHLCQERHQQRLSSWRLPVRTKAPSLSPQSSTDSTDSIESTNSRSPSLSSGTTGRSRRASSRGSSAIEAFANAVKAEDATSLSPHLAPRTPRRSDSSAVTSRTPSRTPTASSHMSRTYLEQGYSPMAGAFASLATISRSTYTARNASVSRGRQSMDQASRMFDGPA